MKGEAYIYKTDGKMDHLIFIKPPDLQVLKDAVEGYIETVPYWTKHKGQPCVVFCNEEGKLKGLNYNVIANTLWIAERSHSVDDMLVGNVIILMGDHEFMEAL